MTWWQIALIVWLTGGVLVCLGYWLMAMGEENDHGSEALVMVGCVGALVWPLYVAWLPVAGVWILAEKLFGRDSKEDATWN